MTRVLNLIITVSLLFYIVIFFYCLSGEAYFVFAGISWRSIPISQIRKLKVDCDRVLCLNPNAVMPILNTCHCFFLPSLSLLPLIIWKPLLRYYFGPCHYCLLDFVW